MNPVQQSTVVTPTINSVTIEWVGNPKGEWIAVLLIEGRPVREADAELLPRNRWSAKFHFLPPDKAFKTLILDYDSTKQRAPETHGVVDFSTLAREGRQFNQLYDKPVEIQTELFVGSEHNMGPWIGECPVMYMWCDTYDTDFWVEGFKHGLFFLPSPHIGCILCPNPPKKYCIDLLAKPAADWADFRKLRKYGKRFRLSVNFDFVGDLQKALDYHLKQEDGTWIDQPLIKNLDKIRTSSDQHGLVFCAFELWNITGEIPTLAAVDFGFGCNHAYHDYTMMTCQRDNTSCGHILTRCVGHLLSKCNYQLWYWGAKMDYMADYDKLGGSKMPNPHVHAMFQGKQLPGAKPVNPVAEFIQQGNALLPALSEEQQAAIKGAMATE